MVVRKSKVVRCSASSSTLSSSRPVYGISIELLDYPLKETENNEIIFQESTPQQTTACSLRRGIEIVQCVYDCISPACYEDYELEEKRIGFRLNSSEVCFFRRHHN